MKKIGLILSLVVIAMGIFMYVNKTFYPTLPIENVSAKEVLKKLNDSTDQIIEIANDDQATWYITRKEDGGITTVDENVKILINERDWNFKEKLGAGLIFEKNNQELIVTTQMWTKKYVLIRIPNTV